MINPTFIGFKETPSDWSVQFSLLFISQCSISLFFIGHHLGSTFTGTDQNGPNNCIRLDCAGHA